MMDKDTEQKFRRLAAELSVGWDSEDQPDPVYAAYGKAFCEAARRINQLVDSLVTSS